jgi:hypothetical protein
MDFIVGLPRTPAGYDYLGNCGPSDQSSPFSSKDHLFGSPIGRIVYVMDCVSTQCSEEDFL